MTLNILRVFYGKDFLPYKDKERVVHYPIVGGSFQCANNITEIRFYFNEISSVNTTFVAVSKLPNGRIGSKVLTNSYDSEIGEYYASLNVSSYYTQYKGDVYISLQGYDGGVNVSYNDETQLYEVSGTPTIAATGSIKLSVAYAPAFIGSGEEENIDLQELLALVSSKIDAEQSIIVIEDISTANLSGYESDQVFYDLTTNTFYTRDGNNFLILYDRHTGLLGKNNTIPRIQLSNSLTQETYDPTLAELNGVFYTFVVKVNNEDFIVSYRSTGVGALRVRDLTYYYATDLTIKLAALCSDTYKQDIVRDGNLQSKVFPFFNVITMTSGSKTLSADEITLIENNPNTKIFYNGFYYDRCRTNPSNQPVFINYEIPYSANDDIEITTRVIVYNSTNHTLNHGSSSITTLTKSKINSSFAHSVETSINTTNYVLTTLLKDADGNVLSTDSVDLPLESIIVSATYYDTYTYDSTTYTNVIVLVLSTTSVPTIIPVGDLVDGLVSTTYLTANYYNKTYIDSVLDTKADKDTTYTKTETDNLLDAKANDNAVVHLAGTETITGNKTFTGVPYFQSGFGVGSRIYGNIAPLYSNTYDIGSSSYQYKDLYLKGYWKDGTNSLSLQNIIDFQATVNEKLTQLFEAVIFESTLSYSYLQWSAIPNNISSYPIVFSGGMEMTNVKGNSAVVNQLVVNGNFAENSDWTITYGSTLNISDNVATFTAGTQYAGMSQYRPFIQGHKYLIIADIQLTTGTTSVRLNCYSNEVAGYDSTQTYTTNTTSKQKVALFKVPTNSARYGMRVIDDRASDWDAILVSNFQCFDLTLMGLDSLTTVDEVRSALLSRGINIDEYNAYNEGSLKDSQATCYAIHGFNLFDGEYETGGINATTGELTPSADRKRTKNYLICKPDTTYYVKNSYEVRIIFYDKNYNYVGFQERIQNNTFVSKHNAYYMKCCTVHDTNPYIDNFCINISNSALNGTYKPYQAPTSASLTLPDMRGLYDTQFKDDKTNVKVGIINLGSLDWTYDSSNLRFNSIIANINPVGTRLVPMLCPLYKCMRSGEAFDVNWDMVIYGTSTHTIYIHNHSYTDAAAFKTAMNGVYMLYPLQTPFDRKDMKEVDLGSLSWDRGTITGSTTIYRFRANISDKAYGNKILCAIYNTKSTVGTANMNNMEITGSAESSFIFIRNDAYTDATAFKTAMNDIKVQYELATPLAENPIVLPSDLVIEKGDSVEITYDSTNNVASDFDFAVATSKIKES